MKYFGTDGIRGKAYVTLTESLAKKVGKSLSLLECKKVIIGYDTRESNHMLADSIAKGAKSVGKEVIDIGVIPTPGLCYNSILYKCLGVMITASHNPYQDNGIKIFFDGVKIKDEDELRIEEFIDSNNDEIFDNYDGKIIQDTTLVKNYINFLVSKIKPSNLRIGLDLANGATSLIGEEIFKNSSNELVVDANIPNGCNINFNVGSTHIENISKIVKDNNLDVGFAFDGDGDRILAVDEDGISHSGDELIFIIAKYLKEKNMLVNNHVVLTIMSNLGIISSLKKNGIDVSLTTVGDRNVLLEMQKNNYIIGGENSGHIIQLNHLSTGDGMLSAIIVLNIMAELNKSLKELTNELEIWPDKLVNLKVKDKRIASDERIQSKVKEILDKHKDKIQLVIRASGTENLLRISCCAESESFVKETIDNFIKLVQIIDAEVK
ncbi:MAG: phosphoglucosamine mutase [Erysipelotrichales bacterium]|nr:phosphoglucosamine mutase [Erysipelotrichales bacterium]